MSYQGLEMRQTIEALRSLQAVEAKLAVIRRDRETCLRRVEVQQRLRKRVDERLAERHRLRREAQMRLDALQLDFRTREESVAKHRAALNTAKTNKEYAAILTALNTEKADNTKLENDMLKEMEAVQAVDVEISQIDAEKAQIDEALTRAEVSLKAFEERVRPDTERLQADRQVCAAGLPPLAISAFSRAAERHDGEAMAPVVKLHPKREDWACSGCNMKVTLEVVNALQTKDDIVFCHMCGRVLYFEASPTKPRPTR